MPVSYFGPREHRDSGYRFVPDLAVLARDSDVLVIAASADHGNVLVTADVLAALGPQGFLINVARGKLVDEAALIRALADGTIAGAGLDVFANEPHVPADCSSSTVSSWNRTGRARPAKPAKRWAGSCWPTSPRASQASARRPASHADRSPSTAAPRYNTGCLRMTEPGDTHAQSIQRRRLAASPAASRTIGRVRYAVLALIFAVTVINYADRATMSIAGTGVAHDLRADARAARHRLFAFAWAYAIGQIPGGWLLDRFGARRVCTA